MTRGYRLLVLLAASVLVLVAVLGASAESGAQSTPALQPTPELKCIGPEVGAGQPPEYTWDLHIQFGVKGSGEVRDYFKEIARECDGLALLGLYYEQRDWQTWLGDVPIGYIVYTLPSLQHAIETADQWANDVDWFGYEFGQNTPWDERQDPSESSRLALEFAREHGLAYVVAPEASRQHAAELAQYADAYGVQAYRLQHQSPEEFIQLVKDVSQLVRPVNPDILLFVAFSTDTPEDDPEVAYELIARLLGDIDGIFIRAAGDAESMERLQTLVNLLRTRRVFVPLVLSQ